LHGSQAAFGKRIGEIRRSRIVISNTAKWSHEGRLSRNGLKPLNQICSPEGE
jgi:hypothetical protein